MVSSDQAFSFFIRLNLKRHVYLSYSLAAVGLYVRSASITAGPAFPHVLYSLIIHNPNDCIVGCVLPLYESVLLPN